MSIQSNLHEGSNDIWGEDKLARRDLAKSFSKIIQSSTDMSDDAIVIGLHASYGMGKSFFLSKWQEQLKEDGYVTVSFDAWENDYCGDPMVSFAAEMRSQLAKFIEGEKFNQTLGRVAIATFDQIPTLQGFIKSEKELVDKTKIGKFGSSLIESYKNAKESIAEFKEELSNIFYKAKIETRTPKHIVVFIDELDRCRPTFAIELLEKIKHIFSVKGYVFVLGFDKEQLLESIRTIYGLNTDAGGYLKRFFNVELNLPTPDVFNFIEYLVDSKFNFPTQIRLTNKTHEADNHGVKQSLYFIAQKFELKLRDIERLTHQCRILIGVIVQDTVLEKPILLSVFTTLVALKLRGEDLYRRIGTKIYDGKSIFSNLKSVTNLPFQQGPEFEEWSQSLIEAFDALCLSEEEVNQQRQNIKTLAPQRDLKRLQRIKDLRETLEKSGVRLQEKGEGIAFVKSLVDATYNPEESVNVMAS